MEKNPLVVEAVAKLETDLSPEELQELTAVRNIANDNGYSPDGLVYARMLTTRAKTLKRLAVKAEQAGLFKPVQEE